MMTVAISSIIVVAHKFGKTFTNQGTLKSYYPLELNKKTFIFKDPPANGVKNGK